MTTTAPAPADLDRIVRDAQRALIDIVPELAHKVRVRVVHDADGPHVAADTHALPDDTAATVRRIVAYVARRAR